MACDRMRELAFLSVDGELSEAEQRELAAHLATCADCRAAQAAAARIAGGVRLIAAPPPPVPVGFAERTLRRLESPAPPRLLPRLLPWAAVAATLIAALIFTVERRRPRDEAPLSIASAPEARRAGEAAPPEQSGRLTPAPALKTPQSGGGDASSLDEAANAPEGAKVTGGKREESVDAEKQRATQLATQLAEGTPADAERRLDELLARARQLDDVGRGKSEGEELERSSEDSIEKRAEKGVEKKEVDRDKGAGGGAAKDADEGFASHGDEGAAKPVALTLRFFRVTGDAKRIGELLANDVKNAKARKDATRDGANRRVVEVDEAQARALAGRLDAAGVRREELTADEWLRAARSAVAPDTGLLADAPAAAPSDAKSKSDNRVGRAAPRYKQAEPPTPGAAKPAAPAPKRERWIILIRRG